MASLSLSVTWREPFEKFEWKKHDATNITTSYVYYQFKRGAC